MSLVTAEMSFASPPRSSIFSVNVSMTMTAQTETRRNQLLSVLIRFRVLARRGVDDLEPVTQKVVSALQEYAGSRVSHYNRIAANGCQIQAILVNERRVIKTDQTVFPRNAGSEPCKVSRCASCHVVIPDKGHRVALWSRDKPLRQVS